MTLGRRQVQLLLVLLLLFFLAWDLRALLTDQRPGNTVSDTTLVDLMDLQRVVQHDGVAGWLRRGNVKGPASVLVAAALHPLVGDPLLAVRLTSVLFHVLVLVLLFRLTRRLTGGGAAGLLAVALCGTAPMEYGWFRLDFHDPAVALALLLTLGLLLRPEPLAHPIDGIKLGLAGGLGLLAKLSFPVFLVAPGIWLLATRVRSWRAALHLLLALAVAALSASWWLVPSWGEIVQNMTDSSRERVAWQQVLAMYTVGLPGTLPLLVAAALGAGLALWRRAVERGAVLCLLCTMLGSLALFVLVFDPWSRYLLPLFPLAGLLAAVGLLAAGQWISQRWPRAPLLWAGAALALVLLAQYAWFNVKGLASPTEPREFHLGLVAPDTREHRAFIRAAALVRQRGWQALDIPSGPVPPAFPGLWIQRGHTLPYLSLEQARASVAGRASSVALVYSHLGDRPREALLQQLKRLPALQPGQPASDQPADPREVFEARRQLSAEEQARNTFLRSRRLRVIRTFGNPDGVRFTVIKVD